MTGKNTKIGGVEHASDAEIEAAIAALSEADTIRLRWMADYRARSFQGYGLGVSGDDLLQEAIRKTVEGQRRWPKSITLVAHLLATMRSDASHARAELEDTVVVAATLDEPTRCLDVAALRSKIPDPELVLAAKQQLDLIRQRFQADDEVSLVLEELAAEKKGPENQKDLGITETDYETIMTRLRRGLDRKEGWRP